MALGSTSIAALNREQLRNVMKTSILGRRFGLDAGDYQVGGGNTRNAVENITTTAASSLASDGFAALTSTAASSAIYTLQAPVVGLSKEITQLSSSTLGFAVQFGAGAQLVTTAGSSFNQAVFQSVGAAVRLSCLSTNGGGVWAVESANTGVTFSTY